MNTFLKSFLPIVLTAAMLFVLLLHPLDRVEGQAPKLPYHDHAPTEPLPPTMYPEQFPDNASRVAYRLASRVPKTLYQVPCYCPCHRREGHQSLLDCFISKHGAHCHICQQEAVFSFLERQKNKGPRQIRKDLAEGKASRIDMEEMVKRFAPTEQAPK